MTKTVGYAPAARGPYAGVCILGGLVQGVSGPGGVYVPRGCLLQGVGGGCLVRGGLLPGGLVWGVSALGGSGPGGVSQHALRQTPLVNRMNDRQV